MQAVAQDRQGYWRGQVKDFEKSGLSKAAYCRVHGLKLTTFKNGYYRKRRANKAAPGKISDFVPLLTTKRLEAGSSHASKHYRLQLKQGMYLEIPLSLPMPELGHLLQLAGELS